VGDGIPVLAEPVHGDGEEDEVSVSQDGGGVVFDMEGVGEGDAGEEADVLAAGAVVGGR